MNTDVHLDANEDRLASPDDEAEAMDWHEQAEAAHEEAADAWIERHEGRMP